MPGAQMITLSITGYKCKIRNLRRGSFTRRFLNRCPKGKLLPVSSAKVSLHEKKLVPEASGIGGHIALERDGFVGVSTFPHLGWSGSTIIITIKTISGRNFNNFKRNFIQSARQAFGFSDKEVRVEKLESPPQ